MAKEFQLKVLYVISFLDLMGVSMIVPSLATYVKSLDDDPFIFGVIMSMYGFIQFFSAPIAGALSDAFGRKRVLIGCFLGASVGYVLLAVSWNVYIVVLSRVPAALFKHTLDIIKVAITDAEEPSKRSGAIGRLNAAANTGFIIGPVIGGYISAYPNGFNYTALVTTAIFLFNSFVVSVFYEDIPSSLSSAQKQDKTTDLVHAVNWGRVRRESIERVLALRHVFKESKATQTLLLAKVLMSMGAILYRTHFSVLLEDKFKADAQMRGWVLSYMGMLGAIGSFSVGFVTTNPRAEYRMLQIGSIVYVGTFMALSHATSLYDIYVLLVPQVLSISLIRACSTALQSSFVSQDRMGAFMGLASSLTSVARTISPIMSGWTYLLSVDGPAYGAAFLASISACLYIFSPHFASIGQAPKLTKAMK